MYQVLPSKSESDKDYTFNGPLFIRRHDLSMFDRMTIAFTVLMAQKHKLWGVVTALSIYMVSRTFIYILAKTLQETGEIFFGNNHFEQTLKDRKPPLSYMLSLRMEGRCSIGATSIIMERFDVELASTGSISEYTKRIGTFSPNTIIEENDEIQALIFLSDEIFSKSIPVLVTVDPISSAILRIELSDTRKAKDWKKHWECIEKNGYYAHCFR